MTHETPALGLYDGMTLAGMTFDEVWLAQLSLGGDLDSLTVEAYVLGLLRPDDYRHNLIAQAINESFIDADSDHPVGYR